MPSSRDERLKDLRGLRERVARWEDFVGEDQQRQLFKDGRDPLAQRIIAFWAELDEPLKF
ncbi:MAG: hypothetical protein ACKOC4_04940 [Planctomycetia bacterium]